MSQLQARELFVFIKPDPIKEKSDGGLFLPGQSIQQQTDCVGTIVSVGEGAYQNGIFIPMKLKVGDRVLFSPMGGQKITWKFSEPVYETIDGKEVLKSGGLEDIFVIQQWNIIAVVQD